MFRNSIILSASAAVLLLLVSSGASVAAIDPDKDLREQLLAVPLTPNLGGDTTVDTVVPGRFAQLPRMLTTI